MEAKPVVTEVVDELQGLGVEKVTFNFVAWWTVCIENVLPSSAGSYREFKAQISGMEDNGSIIRSETSPVFRDLENSITVLPLSVQPLTSVKLC